LALKYNSFRFNP